MDDESSSSEDIANPGRYVAASSGSPVKVFSRSEKRTALGVANHVLSNLSGETLIYRKIKDGKKDAPHYKELKEEKTVRESYQTITLKSGKIIRKSDLAVKRPTEIKKGSPCKKNQLFKFYATKRPRKVIKLARNVGFKSSKATQIE